jgi:hypothetical protein
MSDSQSYLLTLYSGITGTASDPTSSILNAIYGGGTASGTGGTTDPVLALKVAQATETQQVKATAQQASVQTAIAAFTKGVQSATSVDQLLSNPNVMNVLLTANGLSDQIGYTALAKQVLTSNLSDTNSLANTLTDTRWKTIAQTYDFHTNGLTAIKSQSVIDTITNAYAQAQWRSNEDSVTPGLSNALYFIANASKSTSVDQLLSDTNLRTVVLTALGVPAQIAYQDLGAQEQAITSRMDISKLQDPAFVQQFAQRYLIANSTSSSGSSSATDLTTLAVQANGILV